MQRNIDSFFKRLPSKKSDEDISPPPKKRKARAISSDEETIPPSPQVTKSGKELKRARKSPRKSPRKALEIKSPRNEQQCNKKPALSKLKQATTPKKELQKVDVLSFFGDVPKRVEAKKAPKPKDKSIIELEDDAIDQSLMEVDLDESIEAATRKQKAKQPPPVVVVEDSLSPPPVKRAKQESPVKSKETIKTPKATKKAAKSDTPKSTGRSKKQTNDTDLNASVLSDEERHERKRMSAVLYQKFKNRSSCLNPGCKEIPKGAPDCLKGLTFLVTGVLESMERSEAQSVIKEYGGRVMTVVGKKLNYLVVGEDAGPAKLAQAEQFNVNVLSEDGLLDLIRERSDMRNGNHQLKQEASSSGPKIKKEKSEEQPSTSPKVKKESKVSPRKQHKVEHIEKPKVERKEQVKQERKEQLKVEPQEQPKVSTKRSPSKANQDFKPIPKFKTEAKAAETISMAWVDKYKPTTIKEIVGQAGAASNVSKLINWLSKWYSNHDGQKKLSRPNPWAKNDDGSYFKAALLSGPPGIGKTTTATLVCKELDFDSVEFNASDTRSKRLLKEEVATLLSNKSLYGFVNGQSLAISKRHVLIMDEVDGMAGNEDRGGIQELISLIKESSVPIICMCNDRNHPKIRSLVNYCYDLRFQRPRLEQIKGRIMTICCREKLQLTPAKVEEIIAATNNDIRQSINHVALLSAGEKLDLKPQQQATADAEKTAEKDLKLGPWEVVRKVFSADEHKHMTLYDKCDLFFHDYSLAPLFVQQNYLQVTPHGSRNDLLAKVAATADSLSLGDLVDKHIRSLSAWSLLPTQAIFSSVLPGEHMCGHFTGQINFPGWLGKNSRTNKRMRLAQELHDHTRVCTSGSRLSVRLDYAPFLLANIVRPLVADGQEGVAAALNVIKEYRLLREDLESLIELTAWPGKKSPMDAVDGRVKAALTRTYNKEVMAYSYSAQASIKKKRAETTALNDEDMLCLEDEENEGTAAVSDTEDNDELDLGGLVKKKAASKASTSKASTSKASTSKAAGAKKSSGAATKKAKK